MTLIILLLVTFVIAYLLTYIKTILEYVNIHRAARKIPGPKNHPIFGSVLPLIKADRTEVCSVLEGWARDEVAKGNTVMRLMVLGRMYVWPLNGRALAKILDSTTELHKGAAYDFLNRWVGGGLLTLSGDRWKTHRKMLTPSFHFAKLDGYLEVFNSESKILIDQIEKFADSGDTVNLHPYLNRCLLDIICATAMGIKIDAQNNHEHEYLRAVEGFTKLSMVYSFTPWLHIPFIFKVLGYQKMTDQYLATMKGFSEKVIHERRAAIASGEVEKQTSKRMMNFLDLLLSQAESNTLSEQEIRLEVDTFMFGGHDTTTSSSSFALWNIAHHPEVQKKIYDELVEVLGEDPTTDITLQDISKLSYLDRVLKESKRLIAPVPLFQRKLQTAMEIDGYTIPAGSNISIAPLVIHKNATIYAEPTKFDPDRFLPEETAKRHPYDFVPFSAGIRNCIGQKFAQLNEKVLVCHILRNFEIQPTLAYHDNVPFIEVVTKPSRGVPVKLTRR